MRRALLWTGLALGVLAALGCGSTPDASTPADTRTSPRRPGGGAARVAPEDVDLRALLSPVPEYEGQGRNLFVYGPARPREPAPVARPTTPTPRRPTPRPSARAAEQARARARAPGRIDVKYAGYVEKTEASGSPKKYAIFLDGNQILTGAEGDTIQNRFTVVEIGFESVTVSAQGSDATERIPLESN